MRCHGAFLLATALAVPPADALARGGLRCGGGLVSVGDSKLDLLAKCGAPALAERRPGEVSVAEPRLGIGRRVLAPAERWTYDLGRNRFVQVVTLVRGRVTAVEEGSYGYTDEQRWRAPPRKAACEPAVISPGQLKLEVLARCGEPATVDAWEEEVRLVRTVGGETLLGEAVVHAVEVWAYDFGPSRLVRFVRLVDGEVTRVDSGGYGYAE